MDNLVSVIVPCYNQAQYLPEALQSVLDQTYPHWECIIVNDGSPDNTEAVALEWCDKDARFKYLKKENGGLSSARNAGINTSVGEFILPLDADDKIGDTYLQKAITEFKNDKQLVLIYCEAEFFGSMEGLWELPEYCFQSILFKNSIFCSAIYKRDLVRRFGNYDTGMNSYEDWEMWIRILKSGGKVKKLQHVCFYYRKTENSMIAGLTKTTNERTRLRNYIFKKHIDVYEAYAGDLMLAIKERDVYKTRLQQQSIAFYSSKRYKLGNLILKPFSFLLKK